MHVVFSLLITPAALQVMFCTEGLTRQPVCRDAILAKADNLREAGTVLEPYLFVVPGQEDGFDQSFWKMLRHVLRPVKVRAGHL